MKVKSRNMHRWFDQFADFIYYFNRLIFTTTRGFKNSRFILHASGKLRRLRMVHFQKGYVKKQLSARTGACRQCGVCCNLLFTCPMLTKKGRCIIYGSCRPKACKVFPIDQRDIDEIKFCGGQCGYSFNSRSARGYYTKKANGKK